MLLLAISLGGVFSYDEANYLGVYYMHPAVRAHIDGNLSIIRTCLAQIEASLSAEDLGHQTALEARQIRSDTEKSGEEQTYLNEEQDQMIVAGIDSMFEDMRKETLAAEAGAHEQSEFQPAK